LGPWWPCPQRRPVGEPGTRISGIPHYFHPVFITHPDTGRKTLFVDRLMTTRIEGVTAEQSAAMLEELYDEDRKLLAQLIGGVGCWPRSSSFKVPLARAQNAAILTWLVSSTEEGPMEGVVVSARKDGATITVSVVTNREGKYSFPAAKLEPGHYRLSIRARGYELDSPTAVDLSEAQPATAEIKLRATNNIGSQRLSNLPVVAGFRASGATPAQTSK